MQKNDRYNRTVVTEIIRWINQSSTTPLDNHIVAQRAGFSCWHMQRLFKQHTGMTLGQYIRNVRLGHAAIALMNTKSPAIDIALLYRYESLQTFTRSMKHHTGLNPGAIKRLPDKAKYRFRKKIERLLALPSH